MNEQGMSLPAWPDLTIYIYFFLFCFLAEAISRTPDLNVKH